MPIILGIDPGSRITGYGLIRDDGKTQSYIDCGAIQTKGDCLAQRLEQIFTGLRELIIAHSPECTAIEQVFMHKNASSALKLGHARGAAMVASSVHALPLTEYSARQIKQTVVGYGAANKEQVQHMVRQHLHIKEALQADAADALAVALTHAFMRKITSRIPQVKSIRKGRLK